MPSCTAASTCQADHHPHPSTPHTPASNQPPRRSVHLADELVDVRLAVAVVAALDVVLELARAPAAGGVGQLERPQEVRGLLEVRAGGDDLVHEVLDAEDVELAERALDDAVVGERHARLVHLAVAALVDQLAHGLQVGLAA